MARAAARRSGLTAPRGLTALLVVVAAATLVAAAQVDSPSAPVAPTAEAVAGGARLYALNCAVCHGASGRGIDEARLAFPPGDRHCTRCHKPNNRAVQSLAEPLVDNDMFSIGVPPPLVPTAGAPAPLAATASPEALWAYLSHTMPRYEPGRQSPREYWQLTAFLLDLNGREEAAAAAASAASE